MARRRRRRSAGILIVSGIALALGVALFREGTKALATPAGKFLPAGGILPELSRKEQIGGGMLAAGGVLGLLYELTR
jgi:hypothetical protein